jgi:hypothetical protein
MSNAQEAGYKEGAAAERARIVAWLREKSQRYEDNIQGAILFIATCIKSGDHVSPEPPKENAK